jgi:hypothetical protein
MSGVELPPQPPPLRDVPPVPSGRPKVWEWFVVYCVAMAVLYLACAALGVAMIVVDPAAGDVDPAEARSMDIQGAVLLVMGVALLAPFAAAPFLPRRKWVWIFDLVLICLGLTSCCTIPACIPLLLYWLKPEGKAWFERG